MKVSEGCIIVTGGNRGIGLEIVRKFFENGRDVIIACRSEQKFNLAVDNIKNGSSDKMGTLSYIQLDLSSLKSVHNFVKNFQDTGKKLQILINNAGIITSMDPEPTDIQFNEDGYELTIATNHFGPFLLTNLLLNNLKEGFELFGDARIITVASGVHNYDVMKNDPLFQSFIKPLDLNDIFLTEENNYIGLQAYSNSKFMNILFTYALARRLGDNGVTSNCLTTGFIPTTGLFENAPEKLKEKINDLWLLTGSQTTQGTAADIYNYATSNDLKGVTGKYFNKGFQKHSHKDTYDEELQEKLWVMTEKYVNK